MASTIKPALKEYLFRVFRSFLFWGLSVPGAILGLALNYFYNYHLPGWAWTVFFLVVFVVAQFRTFHQVWRERERFRVQRTERIIRPNEYIAKGNSLRNELELPSKDRKMDVVVEDVKKWRRDVDEFLRAEFPHQYGFFHLDAITENDARRFGTPDLSGWIPWMDRRLLGLREILRVVTRPDVGGALL